MAKLLATELSKKTADECLQFFGGYGTVEEYPIERFFRDSRFGTIVAGTSEIMREVIAKAAIDGFVFPKREAEEADAGASDGEAAGPAHGPVEEPPPPDGDGSVPDGAVNPFAADSVSPDVFEADVTDTLEAVFAETRPLVRTEAAPELVPEFVAEFVPDLVPEADVETPAEVAPPIPPLALPRPSGWEPVTLPGVMPSVAIRLQIPTNVAELFETLPLRFRADRAAGWSARFHFRFKDVARSDWTVVIEDGFCHALEGHEGTADCVVTTTEKTYLGIESGQQSPETAFLLGKVKVSNIGAMTRFGKLFRKIAT